MIFLELMRLPTEVAYIKRRLRLLAPTITVLGSRVDSGRHTSADVQRLRKAVEEYQTLEHVLKENEKQKP